MRTCAILFLKTIILWSVGFSVSCGADEPDSLAKAKQGYNEAVSKQVELLDLAFEREFKIAVAAGNLDQIEILKKEQEQFKKNRKMPTSDNMEDSAQKYVKALGAAKDRLIAVYEKEIKVSTRSMKFDEAKAIQTEMKAFIAGVPFDRPQIAKLPLPKRPEIPLPGNPAPKPAPPLTPKPEIPLGPVAVPGQLQISSAAWTYFNGWGFVDDYAESVVQKAALALSQKGELTANVETFGKLNGKNGGKMLELQMRAGTALIILELKEGSVLRMTKATPDELQLKGTRIGETPVELLSASYATKNEKVAPVDKYAACAAALETSTVKVTIPIFTDFAFGQPKVARFSFRVGETKLDIMAEEMSSIQILDK